MKKSKKEDIKDTTITIGPVTDDEALEILSNLPKDVINTTATSRKDRTREVAETVDEYSDDPKFNELYKYGFGAYTADTALSVRRCKIDDFFENSPICAPSINRDEFEYEHMSPHQRSFLDNMRTNNAVMTEFLTEAFRRSLTALLEYNTQATTIAMHATMCTIVDKNGDK